MKERKFERTYSCPTLKDLYFTMNGFLEFHEKDNRNINCEVTEVKNEGYDVKFTCTDYNENLYEINPVVEYAFIKGNKHNVYGTKKLANEMYPLMYRYDIDLIKRIPISSEDVISIFEIRKENTIKSLYRKVK